MNDDQHDMRDIEEFMPPQMIMRKVICVGAGLILPLLLIPIVRITGISEIIEELTKALVIFFVVLALRTFGSRVVWTIVFGFFFSLSETMLYLSQIINVGDYSIFLKRLALTLPMHIVTALIILFFGNLKNRYLIVIGLILSIVIHLAFNHFVGVLF